MRSSFARFARPSPAMIVSMVALFIALSGTAVATTSALITGRQIANNSITGADVKNKSLTAADFKGSVRGARGPQGPRGAQGTKGDPGAAGLQGVPGVQGPTGSAAASMLIGAGNAYNAGTTPWFYGPSGFTSPYGGDPELDQAVMLSPNATVVARDLAVEIATAAGGLESRVFTLRVNNADTALSCTISGTAKACNSGDATVTVPPRSRLSLKVQESSAAPNTFFSFGWRATTP